MFIKYSFLVFILAALLVVSIAACGSEEPAPASGPDADTHSPTAAPQVDSVAATSEMTTPAMAEEMSPATPPLKRITPRSMTQSEPDWSPAPQSEPASDQASSSARVQATPLPEAMMASPQSVEVEQEAMVEVEKTATRTTVEEAGETAAYQPAPQPAAAPAASSPVSPPGSASPQGFMVGPQGARGPGVPPSPQGESGSLSGSKPPTLPHPPDTIFQNNRRQPAVSTYEDAVSTFSLDTDRTSYRLALHWAQEGYRVEPNSVRAEEWINSFDYGYHRPANDADFAIYTDVFRHPLEPDKHIARVAFQAPDIREDYAPLNVTLVLDASGSMAEGNRVDIARAAAERIRQSLRSQDRIAVVQFSESVIRNLTVRHTNPDDRMVQRSINRLQPNSATNVQAGLDLGVQLADRARRRNPEAVNYVILMSDGVANVDATNPFAILESVSDRDRQNPLRLITIGVGIANYNDYLLEQLAQHGNGWYRYLDSAHQAQSTFSRENWLNLAVPFADQTRAQITWHSDLVRTWRIIGYENRVTADANFTQNRKEFAEIPSGAATTVFYELELTRQATDRRSDRASLGEVRVRWVEPGSGVTREQRAEVTGNQRDRVGDFDSLGDPMLIFGTLIGLSADRYSAAADSFYTADIDAHRDLPELFDRGQRLQRELGHLTAYQDFMYLLDYMIQDLPDAVIMAPRDSGYSP